MTAPPPPPRLRRRFDGGGKIDRRWPCPSSGEGAKLLVLYTLSMLALRSGTPNSRRQTSARTSTPFLMVSGFGLAKQSRRRLRAYSLSVDHSGPGLSDTPAA